MVVRSLVESSPEEFLQRTTLRQQKALFKEGTEEFARDQESGELRVYARRIEAENLAGELKKTEEMKN